MTAGWVVWLLPGRIGAVSPCLGRALALARATGWDRIASVERLTR